MESNVTFVTSYIKIYDEDYETRKSFENRLQFFLKLADAGINICIFSSPEYKETFDTICKKYKNIKFIESICYDDLTLVKLNKDKKYSLPAKRHTTKDTEKYMYLMNSKIELVKKVIDINPYSSDYFAWIDFSLPYVFKHIDKTIQDITSMYQRKFTNSFLVIPGMYDNINDINYIRDNIYWRFCGGFFFGDKASVIDFYNVSMDNFSDFVNDTQTLVWEVNYWSWLETNKKFNPLWYSADHNDSMMYIPEKLLNQMYYKQIHY